MLTLVALGYLIPTGKNASSCDSMHKVYVHAWITIMWAGPWSLPGPFMYLQERHGVVIHWMTPYLPSVAISDASTGCN